MAWSAVWSNVRDMGTATSLELGGAASRQMLCGPDTDINFLDQLSNVIDESPDVWKSEKLQVRTELHFYLLLTDKACCLVVPSDPLCT